jgi:hypothetical protein
MTRHGVERDFSTEKVVVLIDFWLPSHNFQFVRCQSTTSRVQQAPWRTRQYKHQFWLLYSIQCILRWETNEKTNKKWRGGQRACCVGFIHQVFDLFASVKRAALTNHKDLKLLDTVYRVWNKNKMKSRSGYGILRKVKYCSLNAFKGVYH